MRCSFLYPVRQVLDIDPRWASALCRLPAPRWQRTEAVPSVVPLCYDAEWMALQKAPETVWHVVGKGGGKWEILKLWIERWWKGKSKERDYRQTAWLPIHTHYIYIYCNGFLDISSWKFFAVWLVPWMPWAGQPSAPRKCTIQTDQVWKINPWKEVGTFQSASSQQVS